jgi:hypothetical protein
MGIDQHLRKPNGQSRESSNMGNTKHMTKHTPQYRKLRILAAQTQPKKKNNAVNPDALKVSIISYN